jgi:hypothetical protein
MQLVYELMTAALGTDGMVFQEYLEVLPEVAKELKRRLPGKDPNEHLSMAKTRLIGKKTDLEIEKKAKDALQSFHVSAGHVERIFEGNYYSGNGNSIAGTSKRKTEQVEALDNHLEEVELIRKKLKGDSEMSAPVSRLDIGYFTEDLDPVIKLCPEHE